MNMNVLHNVEVTSIKKNLHVAKSSRIDQISAKSIKDSAPLIAIHLADIIYLSIKLVFFLRNRIWLKFTLYSVFFFFFSFFSHRNIGKFGTKKYFTDLPAANTTQLFVAVKGNFDKCNHLFICM